MTTKVQYLFEMDKLLVRPTPEQSQFETNNYEFLKRVPYLVNLAFEQTRQDMKGKKPLSMNFSWFANSMNGNVLAEIGEEYAELIKPTGRKNHSITLFPNYECYIKKLTKGLFPSYNYTDTTSAMVDMMALPEQDPLPVLFIGYTLNKSNEAVTGCFVVCIKGKERLWATDLTSLRPSISVDSMNINSKDPVTQPDLEIQVKPKEIKKAK